MISGSLSTPLLERQSGDVEDEGKHIGGVDSSPLRMGSKGGERTQSREEFVEAEKMYIGHVRTVSAADESIAKLLQWKKWLNEKGNDANDVKKLREVQRLLLEVEKVRNRAVRGRTKLAERYPQMVKKVQ